MVVERREVYKEGWHVLTGVVQANGINQRSMRGMVYMAESSLGSLTRKVGKEGSESWESGFTALSNKAGAGKVCYMGRLPSKTKLRTEEE